MDDFIWKFSSIFGSGTYLNDKNARQHARKIARGYLEVKKGYSKTGVPLDICTSSTKINEKTFADCSDDEQLHA